MHKKSFEKKNERILPQNEGKRISDPLDKEISQGECSWTLLVAGGHVLHCFGCGTEMAVQSSVEKPVRVLSPG